MKKLIIGLTILAAINSQAYDCSTELSKNKHIVTQINKMVNVTESERSLLLEMTANARKSVELSCGLRSAKVVDPLVKIEESRQQILDLRGISEAERSILLEMNASARQAVELSL